MTATAPRPLAAPRPTMLGTGRLWTAAIAIFAIRIVADLIRTAITWAEGDLRWPVVAAWAVLLVAAAAVITATRALGERLPGWLLAGFAAAVGIAIALDVVAHWGSTSLAAELLVSGSAATSLLLIATTRPSREVLALALAATVGVALASMASGGFGTPSAADLGAYAQMLVPAVVLISVVTAFHSFVQVELDRSIVQGTVAAPRLAVGMLASEELARLDLAAEEVLTAVADGEVPLPLPAASAERAAELATQLRLHLLEGRKQTWLYHAITESGRLGRAVTVSDPDSIAGMLDSGQRDGLLSTIWLLLDPRGDRSGHRSIALRIGPMQSLPETSRRAVVPIVLTTTGVQRTRVDPAIWAELQRVGQYWDSVEEGSLRLDIRCMTAAGPGA